VQSNADKLDYPILMIHGTADKICDIDGTRQFIANTTQRDKTALEYEGGYHELFNDIERQRVLADVQSWIEARL
jgi:alpha-beta hydrolase superfamily lysophospholipase